jgi:hypothetical protein
MMSDRLFFNPFDILPTFHKHISVVLRCHIRMVGVEVKFFIRRDVRFESREGMPQS